MKMAGIDGIDVLKKIKKDWPDVPVIMMTAYGELEKTEEVMALGAEKYFTKPFDIYEVRDAVNALLKVSRLGSGKHCPVFVMIINVCRLHLYIF